MPGKLVNIHSKIIMSKKYDVYGIGNALVDIEFNVTDEFLEKYHIKKGVMTLVDEETQQKLIRAIDQKETVIKSGGSGANTVIAVSQFGGTAFYSCKVSNDELGDVFLRDMKEANIKTNLDEVKRDPGITGKCLVMTTEDTERTMNTFLGITTSLSVDEVDEVAIKNSKYVYMEGYPVASETAFEALKLTKKIAEVNGIKTSLTLSDPSVVDVFGAKFKELIGGAVDLLFCNEEEAKMFTGKDNLEEAREELKEWAHRFAITQGKNGAMIFDGDTFIDIEPYEVDAVDSLGAGDMFSGAFLYAITNGRSFASAGKLASMASSRIVSQFGPRLEQRQAQQILKKFSQ